MDNGCGKLVLLTVLGLFLLAMLLGAIGGAVLTGGL
jgi:hypothetical protein